MQQVFLQLTKKKIRKERRFFSFFLCDFVGNCAGGGLQDYFFAFVYMLIVNSIDNNSY